MTPHLKSAASVSDKKFKIRAKTHKDSRTDRIDRVGVSFVQYAVFYEKGVGRGRGIHSGKTQPHPTINPVLSLHVPILANRLGMNTADLLAKALIR